MDPYKPNYVEHSEVLQKPCVVFRRDLCLFQSCHAEDVVGVLSTLENFYKSSVGPG